MTYFHNQVLYSSSNNLNIIQQPEQVYLPTFLTTVLGRNCITSKMVRMFTWELGIVGSLFLEKGLAKFV